MRGVLLLLLLSLSFASPATAQQSNEEIYLRAQEDYLARRYTDALDGFEKIQDESPNARLYVARCLFKLKRFLEAYEQMKLTIKEARGLATKEPRYAATRDAAKGELNEFKKEVAFVQPRLLGRFELKTLRINRRELPTEDVACIRKVAAGKKLKPEEVGCDQIAVMPDEPVTLRATADGFDVFTADEIDVDKGRRTTVEIAMTPTPGYVARLAKKAPQQKQKSRPRTRAAVPPPRMPPARHGCASIAGDRRQDWVLLMAVFAGLLAVRRRADVDARRCQPVHSKTTHGRPGTRCRDRGVATPPRAARRARQAGGGLGS